MDELCGQMDIFEVDDSTTHLGLPNDMGRKKIFILGFLKDKLKKRRVGRSIAFSCRQGGVGTTYGNV
ncbi:hypothetical protein F8388_000194 [Cannabis sativa]|uniref:Uncharacterized protein n=1 Tax=Cannabis sativa TaxID=3483 RepID=A0A7J6F0Q2_CANSA|nr:hypothetical protein F8388_000194 [Cannabis sativa]